MLGLPLPNFPELIARVVTLVAALSFHEFAHAWVANRLGDDTPRLHGRLTLNPLAHLDPLGALMLLVAGFGWAKPVPINPYALRRRTPAGVMLVSAAGPFSNLLLAILAALPFRFGLMNFATSTFITNFLWYFLILNLILFFFNLIPLFPLDGEKVLTYFLPPSWQESFSRLRPIAPVILMALLFLGPALNLPIFTWLVGMPAEKLAFLLAF
jgi:Zn-dependent protease